MLSRRAKMWVICHKQGKISEKTAVEKIALLASNPRVSARMGARLLF